MYQGTIRSKMAESPPLLRYFHSAYVPVRVVQVPCRDANQLIFDSATSALGNSPVFKADDEGVLDVRRLRITQKTGEFTGLRRIAPCTPTLPSINKDLVRSCQLRIGSDKEETGYG